ncbi:MAG: hypothetical protein ACOCXA_05925, partial [Planctomycetota bacterium]
MIAVLVIGVGVMFGMGGSLALLKGGGPAEVAEGIDQTDVRRHVRLLMQEYMLRGQPMNFDNQRLQAQLQNWALQDLILAQRAEEAGLMPKGETRKALLRDFLRTELPGGDRQMLDAIRELEGTEDEIDIGQLTEYLVVQQAAAAYRSRHLPVPAVSDASGRLLAHIQKDQVETDEVELSTAPLVGAIREEVAADETAIEDTYQELKFERFRIPEAIRLQVLAADADAIAEAVAVRDATVQAYYDDHQDEFTQPAEEDASAEA